MFLLDPDEALSREDLMQKIWDNRLTPPLRAEVLGMAQARGCTWQDIFLDLFDQYDIMMADPSRREEWLRTHEEMERQRAMPLGSDPMLKGKDGNP
jgi:hypothetical protein